MQVKLFTEILVSSVCGSLLYSVSVCAYFASLQKTEKYVIKIRETVHDTCMPVSTQR